MSLYRGAGGASDATDDSTVNAVAGYAASAATSATSAANSATSANTSASTAASSASSAASSASSVATNAANAASSASLANTYAGQASSSKDAAAASAVIASTQAGLASSSQSNAASSAATATTKANEAAQSALDAETAAEAASENVSEALEIYESVETLQSAVAAAAASAASATTQAANAAASAVDADESEELAYEHEQNAAEWATVAQGAANSSQAYSSASAAARDAALAALDSFDDRYLGQKAADPTVDNDGNTLIAGALYFNNQDNVMKVYEGSVWVAAYASLSGALLVNNNLSDVASVSAARTNLGLGTAATTDSTAYATAAQGTKADTAFGWGNHASAGYAADSAVVKLTGDQTVAGTKTFSSTISGSITGNAGTVTNGVYTSGDQTIGGTKTFSSTISGSITGNAGTVTNGVYTTGDQTIGGTKTFSSNPLISSGVANGVAYLNGSKVLTTGSALTFDGTGFGVGGAITNRVSVTVNTADTDGVRVTNSSSGGVASLVVAGANGNGISGWPNAAILESVGAGGLVTSAFNGPMIFQVNGRSEQMRLTSTGLGIGTSSPGVKLDVNAGNIRTRDGSFVLSSGTTQRGVLATYNNLLGSGTDYTTTLFAETGLGINFCVNGSVTRAAVLDSSGNLGLGVTPSAWSASARAIQVGAYSGFYQNASGLPEMSFNSFQNTSNIDTYRVSANPAAKYRIGSGHTWFIAPTGTAGNAISFTQAMTLDADSVLAIGGTRNGGYNSAFKLQVGADTGTQGLMIRGAETYLGFDNGASAFGSGRIYYNASSDYMSFSTDAIERARIANTGNMGIGTTDTSNGRLNVTGPGTATANSVFFSNVDGTYNPYLQIQHNGLSGIRFLVSSSFGGTSGNLTIAPANVDTAVFTTSGNFGVGTTSPNYLIDSQTTSTAITTNLKVNAGAAAGNYGEIAFQTWNGAGSGLNTFGGSGNSRPSVVLRGLSEDGNARGAFVVATFGGGSTNATLTEKMRLDSSGNLLVGKTSSGSSGVGSVVFGSGTFQSTMAGTSTNFHAVFANNSGTTVGSITSSGSTTGYNTSSDYRLKENIQDAAPASALIDSLQVRQYDWKSDGNHQRYGFVAQELLTVAPEAVHQPANPEEMMAVDYSKLVPMLVKEIQSLRQRLAALESN